MTETATTARFVLDTATATDAIAACEDVTEAEDNGDPFDFVLTQALETVQGYDGGLSGPGTLYIATIPDDGVDGEQVEVRVYLSGTDTDGNARGVDLTAGGTVTSYYAGGLNAVVGVASVLAAVEMAVDEANHLLDSLAAVLG